MWWMGLASHLSRQHIRFMPPMLHCTWAFPRLTGCWCEVDVVRRDSFLWAHFSMFILENLEEKEPQNESMMLISKVLQSRGKCGGGWKKDIIKRYSWIPNGDKMEQLPNTILALLTLQKSCTLNVHVQCVQKKGCNFSNCLPPHSKSH